MFLHSKKFDGGLHYRYPVQIVEQTAERLVTYTPIGVPVQSYRGDWPARLHLLGFFWPRRNYVLHVCWEQEWKPHWVYVDISTGTRWSDAIVEYVDLDLDVVLGPDSPVASLEDEDEFAAHRVRWDYPPELVSQCRQAVQEVRQLFQLRQPPFTAHMFDWRPGTPLPI